MDRKKDIIKILNSMSGRYSTYEVFSDDLLQCAGCE